MYGKKPTKAGFTLIELLVVVSLSIMLMLTASALFMTFLIGSSKTNSNILVKNEGSYALAQIEFLIRNAIDILPNQDNQICDSGMTELVIKSIDGGVTSLSALADPGDADKIKIASSSGTVNQFLTSGAVTISAGPTFTCTQTADDASPYITVSFTLQKGTPGVDQPRDIVQQVFTTSVNIRNF